MIGYATMPTLDVLARWSEATGLGVDSAEWAEVVTALAECGLLGADPRQHDLFADYEPLPGDADRAWRLWLAVLGGAYFQQDADEYDPATNTAVIAALLDVFYTKLPATDPVHLPRHHAELALILLRGDLPRRFVRITDSPGDALRALLRDTLDHDGADVTLPKVVTTVLAECAGDDELSVRCVRRVADVTRQRITPLCQGQWLTYRTDTHLFG